MPTFEKESQFQDSEIRDHFSRVQNFIKRLYWRLNTTECFRFLSVWLLDKAVLARLLSKSFALLTVFFLMQNNLKPFPENGMIYEVIYLAA